MTMTTEELEKETLDVIGKVMAQSRKIIDEQRMKIADLQAANKAMMLQANTDGGNAHPAQPSALQRLEEWQKDAPQTRAYSVQAGKNVYVVWLYVNGYRIGKSIAGTIADAINAALDEAEGGE